MQILLQISALSLCLTAMDSQGLLAKVCVRCALGWTVCWSKPLDGQYALQQQQLMYSRMLGLIIVALGLYE